MIKSCFKLWLPRLIVLFFVCCILVGFRFTTVKAAEDTLSINVGSEFTIENGGSNIRCFPFLSAFNDDVFVTFSQHIDDYLDHPADGMRISRNDGSTWPTYTQNPDFYLSSLIKLSNGDLFGMSYITYYSDDRHSTCHYWKSIDNGANWTHYTGTITFPQDQSRFGSTWGGMLFHRNMIQTADGSLMAPMYGNYSGDTKNRCVWAKSTDGGANWSIISTIAYSPSAPDEGYCEPVVAKCADNSLLCVMRVGSNYPLYQCRSNDNGMTWSTPVNLPGVNSSDTYSVDPDLCLMSNGTLVLSYGRPNCRLLFSIDGKGNSWGNLTTTYSSTTSGYTGIREMAPNKLLVIGDKGTSWQSPPSYHIWGKYVDVVRNTNPDPAGTKIDLLSKYNAGQIIIDTDMTWTDTSYPDSKISGAIDGSIEYWHSAFKPNTTVPSYYTIMLDQTYAIKSFGICLKPGYTESADIYFSTDGTNWGSPVKSYTNVNQSFVEYTTFTTPINARYAKVVATSASGWPGLNEIELYKDTSTETKIDLLSKYNANQVTVDTDMTWTDTSYPDSKISGAIDGSIEYWHSAFKPNTTVPSYYTITLDQMYAIKRLGICLKPEHAESANIYFSTDGINWGNPVVSYTNTNHLSVEYATFATPINARYAKVVVTSASGWPGLNEIEFYY